mmetsp:Transcript_2596/g.4073  ORF Transcript_2596/g.4073 Transcript_2596/m.4073 type:complete len:238 (-) Transcript_2596:664-1377(-)
MSCIWYCCGGGCCCSTAGGVLDEEVLPPPKPPPGVNDLAEGLNVNAFALALSFEEMFFFGLVVEVSSFPSFLFVSSSFLVGSVSSFWGGASLVVVVVVVAAAGVSSLFLVSVSAAVSFGPSFSFGSAASFVFFVSLSLDAVISSAFLSSISCSFSVAVVVVAGFSTVLISSFGWLVDTVVATSLAVITAGVAAALDGTASCFEKDDRVVAGLEAANVAAAVGFFALEAASALAAAAA